MKFDITWSITAIIAVISFLSPIVVSIINNKHQYAMRKLELNANLADKQLISLYNQKVDAYKKFVRAAGKYSLHNLSTGSAESYTALNASLHEVMILCDSETYFLLLDFQSHIDTLTQNRADYNSLFTKISASLNRELSSLLSQIN